MATLTGYSGTPLPKKLGLKAGATMVLLNAPLGIEAGLLPLPLGASLASSLAADNSLVVLFCKDMTTLKKALPGTAKKLAADGSLWISWPKKSSSLFVDLTEDGIRSVVLPMGLVDVKVCAVNADWSGLKLMIRKEKRGEWNR